MFRAGLDTVYMSLFFFSSNTYFNAGQSVIIVTPTVPLRVFLLLTVETKGEIEG